MSAGPILETQQAARWRHALLVSAALAGVTAGIIVLSSQEVADFLREGPVRVTGMKGETLRLVLGLGALVSTALAVIAIWPRAGIRDIAAGLLALGLGLFLVHALLIPVALLFSLAVIADLAGRIPRERLQELGPRRFPIPWAIGGAGAGAGLVALVWLSVWLVQPLFDEGETLNATLAFSVAGLEQSVPPSSTVDAPAAGQDVPAAEDGTAEDGAAEDSAAEDGAAEVGPAVEDAAEVGAAGDSAEPTAQGMLVSRGELMGVDAFHTGSGDVLLLVGPVGELLLRFQDYAVRNGPDLHVYLTPDPGASVHAAGAIDLGPVKATSGSVNYDVPEGTDLGSFRAVVIYCVPFAVTFATAALNDA